MISLNPYDASTINALFSYGGGLSGIRLPDGSTSSFSLGFTVPPDYVDGTRIGIRMLWNIDDQNCSLDLDSLFLSFARPGISPPHSDLEVNGGILLAAPANALDITETFAYTPASSSIEAGDSVTFGMQRSDSVDDTCAGDWHIQGLSVVYQGHTSFLPLVTR